MGLRGTKPKGKVKIEWSANFAYAIGLIVSDGCLYNNGRHINFTTKDLEQAEHFKMCLGIELKNAMKGSGYIKEKTYYNLQFSDVLFYKFLNTIGITSAKSKTIGEVHIPDEYFFDYLRGYFDGDGCFYSYWDKRWASSFMFYISFACASFKHMEWLRKRIFDLIGISGHMDYANRSYQLKYAKKESLELIQEMYYSPDVICLTRKREKIFKALAIEDEHNID